MISWGVKVNQYGNAILDESGNFIKLRGEGVTEDLWHEMVSYANDKSLKKGDYKKLNLPFEKRILAQPKEIRERMEKGVEDFAYDLLAKYFNASDTAPLAMEAILEAGSCELGPKAKRIENPAEWTREKILEKAAKLHKEEKGPKGNYED